MDAAEQMICLGKRYDDVAMRGKEVQKWTSWRSDQPGNSSRNHQQSLLPPHSWVRHPAPSLKHRQRAMVDQNALATSNPSSQWSSTLQYCRQIRSTMLPPRESAVPDGNVNQNPDSKRPKKVPQEPSFLHPIQFRGPRLFRPKEWHLVQQLRKAKVHLESPKMKPYQVGSCPCRLYLSFGDRVVVRTMPLLK